LLGWPFSAFGGGSSGGVKRPDTLPASSLAADYGVSAQVAYAALEMLAVNHYIARPQGRRYYRVTWQAGQ
jgi:hypothetical protein